MSDYTPVTPVRMFEGILNEYWRVQAKPLIDALDTKKSDAELTSIINNLLLVCRSKTINGQEFIYNDWFIPGLNDEYRACKNTQIDTTDSRSAIFVYSKRITVSVLALHYILKGEGADKYLIPLNEHYNKIRSYEKITRDDMIFNIKEIGEQIFSVDGVFDTIIANAEAGNWKIEDNTIIKEVK